MAIRELKVGLMLALIFSAGLFTGVLLDRRFASPELAGRPRNAGPREAREHVMAEMKEKLRFTPQQEQRVGEILDDWSRKLKEVRRDALKERLELFERTMPMVRTNLTPAQIPAYNDLTDRVRRRHRQMINRAN
jgi:hypothetical protein